jgi:hypothetical protein
MSRYSRERRKKLPKYGPAVVVKGLQALDTGAMKPGLYTIDVKHDDWCDLLAGKGACNCNPEVGEPHPYKPAGPYQEEEYAAIIQRLKPGDRRGVLKAELLRMLEECGTKADRGDELAQWVLRMSAIELGATHEGVDALPTWRDVAELVTCACGLV